jgi:hypothetical protein
MSHTAEPPVLDTTMMYAVHDAFTRDLDGVAALADHGQVPARAGWDRFRTYLHIHHTAEDTHLWPVLRGRLAGRPGELAVLDQMETEHGELDLLLAAVDRAFGAAPAELVVPARLLRTALVRHCHHEEDDAMPLVVDNLTAGEWTAFGTEQRRQLGLRGASSFIPWVLDGAADETQRTVLGMLPPPVRLLYRCTWRPRYLRGPRLLEAS